MGGYGDTADARHRADQEPPILAFFAFDHLADERLRAVSEPFSVLAHQVAAGLPPGPETSVCLRKLLEAKDAAVRAAL
ncbi:MAG TPA: hypothetical protein VGF32_02535 [Streptosporangiaceae bacterium]|jgi:hypothetical protein